MGNVSVFWCNGCCCFCCHHHHHHYCVFNWINDIFNLQKRQTPWFNIFTSLPMWALVIAHCGYNWGFFTMLVELPSYMNSILKFDLKSVSDISYNIQFHARVVLQGGAARM
jgi:hypothetical protein